MVNRIIQELQCIGFETEGPQLDKEIKSVTIKAEVLPYKHYFQLHFHVEDLPLVHKAVVCLCQLETVKEIIKIKPIFSKINSRIIRCSGYPLRPHRTSDYAIISKLRARCLI